MQRRLPAGTVTFVFTDVEGSTRLLRELGAERYAGVLADYRRVLRGAFGLHGGVEVDSQGDGFFWAFPTAPDALEAGCEAQRALSLPVRMGIHTGVPLLTKEGYVGADVHRAARIAGAAHGGQILVSAATAALVDAVVLRDLGEHRLKDFSAPEHLFQVGHADFAPLRTLYRTNAPIPATAFLGREAELARVRELLVRDEVRLLTLTGPGGSGKTRLALQAAGDAAELYPDGIWWVPLASLADSGQVIPAIARALGGGESLPELVGDRRLLLLLDNFEHVVGAAGEVASLLALRPKADVLVTSRERLRVQGEHVYAVPVLARAEALELFATCARAQTAAFSPGDILDKLCARLDDLPLALELAAARTSLLTPAQLLERLSGRLDLLRGGRDAERRHETLRATLEWSYDLLTEEEQRAFAAFAVFVGGWMLEAAEEVVQVELDVLESLVDKSLLRQTDGRLSMLETIRDYALERFMASSSAAELCSRHARYFAALAERHDEVTAASARPAALARLASEIDNFRAAFRWAAAHDSMLALRLATVAGWYRLPVAEWHQLCREALPALDTAEPQIRIRFLLRATYAAKEVRDLDHAVQLYELLLTNARTTGDARAERLALGGLGDVALFRGDTSSARRLYEAALAQTEDADDRVGLIHVLGEVSVADGELKDADELFHEALAIASEHNLQRLAAKVTHSVGDLALRRREIEAARTAYISSASLARNFHDPKSAVYCLAGLAAVAATGGDHDLAAAYWQAVCDAHQQHPIARDHQTFYLDYLRDVDLGQGERFASLDQALDAALSRN